MVALLLILIVSFITGIESCENQTALCIYSYWNTHRVRCDNPICDCSGLLMDSSHSRFVVCKGVLSDNPLNQIPIALVRIRLEDNNITTIKRGTFNGLNVLVEVFIIKNNIETIETGAFENLRSLAVLELNRNKIKVIEKHSFKNIPKLSRIDLPDNSLTTIRSGTFDDFPSLLFLNLSANAIRVIEHRSFVNLPNVGKIDLSANEISVIEENAFSNIFVNTLDMDKNNLTIIQRGAFKDIPRINILLLRENGIKVIESQAFYNITTIDVIVLNDNPVVTIEAFAFSTLMSDRLIIIIAEGKLRWIKEDAFTNLTGTELVLGVDHDVVIEENFSGNFMMKIHILTDYLNCNCSLMWIALWLKEDNNNERIQNDVLCRNENQILVNNLTIEYFSKCKDMSDQFVFAESDAVSITCSFRFIRGEFVEWIHTRNGRHIRTLKTQSNVLSIPFCSTDDTGDYTCVRSTRYSSVPYINTTTTLLVKGKPVIFNPVTRESGVDLVLSVTFYSIIGVEVRWILGDKVLQNSSDYQIKTSTVNIKLVQYNQEILVDALMTNLTIYNYNSLVSKAYTCRISNDLGSAEEVLLSRPVDIVLQRNTLCDSSTRLEIDCVLNALGAEPKYFKHINGGKTIRTLTGTRINNTYTLTIPFCNYQDIGEYTCNWDTGIPGLEHINKTTTLIVNGPPIILDNSKSILDAYTILSVMFYSQPYPSEPKWYLDNDEIVPGSDIQLTTTFSIVEIQLHRVTTYVDGFISNLTFKTEKERFGDYKCVVENSYGSSKEIVTLKREQTSVNNQDGSPTSSDIIPVILGAVGGVVSLALIVIVSVYLKRRLSQPKETSTYDESAQGSDAVSYYDSIKMSSKSTTHEDYMEVF